MKEKAWRKKVAAGLILSLCVGLIPAPLKASEQEPEAQATDKTTAVEHKTPEAVEDTAWESEEVVMEVDEEGKDEWGNEYGIASGGVDEGKMSLLQVGDNLPENENGELILRVADKVVKEGKEYEVTVIRSYLSKKQKMHIYVGKNIDTVSFLYDYVNGDSKEYSVHSSNPYYTSEKGSLYTKDKTTLCYFCDAYYGENSVFQIPETVKELENFCFYAAKIKEVVLNDKIKTIPYSGFNRALIERIDLKQVNKVRSYAFANCKYLEEIKMVKEGIRIGEKVFNNTENLKNLYFPPKTELAMNAYMNNKNMETLIFGEGCTFAQGMPLGGLNLKLVILPSDCISIGNGFDITPAPLLRNLYIPDTVESISKGALNAKGYLILYGKKDSPAANYEDPNVTFCSFEEHEHVMENVTFYEYDTWAVQGKYCKKCGRAEEIKVVDFTDEKEKEDRPELLTYPEDKCPETLKLNDSNTDEQGLIYTLDESSHEAKVKDINTKQPSLKKIFLIPENVEKEGVKYTVKTLLYRAMSGAPIVILPDTVTYIEHGNFELDVFRVTLGKGVKVMEEDVFYGSSPSISIRGDNPYYKMVDGVLYDAQMKELIKSVPNVKRRECVVPKSVRFIRKCAFFNDEYLEKITVYSKKMMSIHENAIVLCSAEVVEQEPNPEVSEEITIEDYSWEGEEKIVELDEEYKDSEGFYYELNQEENTAVLETVDLSRWEDDRDEIDKRIPDKVIYDGKKYTVTGLWMGLQARRDPHNNDEKNRRNQTVNLYIGRYVTTIRMSALNMKIASYVHVLNSNFISVKGSLFNKDQTKLYRFCDREYVGTEYHLPEELQEMEDRVFYQTNLRTVVFNDRITSVPENAFECSNIEKADLVNVKRVEEDAFSYCYYLKEVIFRQENIDIRSSAFYMTKNLKSIYIPANSKIESAAFRFSGIKRVILGENVSLNGYMIFDDCYDLQIVNLPETMTEIEEYTFGSCYNLQKLYIPESVISAASNSFKQTDMQIYSYEKEIFEKLTNTASQPVSLKEHEHTMEEVTFFSFDTWSVTGKYCKTCGWVTETEKREYENKKEEALPDPLVIEKQKSPQILELNDANEDEQGFIYTLYPDTMTATLTDTNHSLVVNEHIVIQCIPAQVKKGEQIYTVDTIGEKGVDAHGKVVLPDTIRKLEKNCISAGDLVLDIGNGVEEVDADAFAAISTCIEVYLSEENPYFVFEEDALMNRERTILYKHTNYGPVEYTVSATVKKIAENVFGGYMIHQINLYDAKNISIASNAFDGRSAYINRIEEPAPIPTPTATPTVTPTPSPTSVPTATPMPSPTSVPPATPTISPTVTPTITQSPIPSPPVFPTSSPVILPTVSPTATPAGMPTSLPMILPSQNPTDASNQSPSLQTGKSIPTDVKEEKKNLTIRGFRLKTYRKGVNLTWKYCANAEFYRVYRAEKKKKYKLIQTLTGIKTSFVDKKINPAKRYCYKIIAVGRNAGKLQEGTPQTLSITVPGLEKPIIKVKKGRADLVRYISIILKKYQGTHAQVYLSLNGRKFTKLKMTSGKIAKFKGRFRFECKLKNKVLWLKVRTYKKAKKGKRYSEFSKVAKIRV